MNEITLSGNVGAEPVLRRLPNSRPILNFSIAINNGYRDRASGAWVEKRPIWQTVVAYGDLAEHAHATLRKGMALTVTGTLADNSFVPKGEDREVVGTKLEARDIAVSLRWATATVVRTPSQDGAARQAAPVAQDLEPAHAA